MYLSVSAGTALFFIVRKSSLVILRLLRCLLGTTRRIRPRGDRILTTHLYFQSKSALVSACICRGHALSLKRAPGAHNQQHGFDLARPWDALSFYIVPLGVTLARAQISRAVKFLSAKASDYFCFLPRRTNSLFRHAPRARQGVCGCPLKWMQ